jgi:hypothetical protein
MGRSFVVVSGVGFICGMAKRDEILALLYLSEFWPAGKKSSSHLTATIFFWLRGLVLVDWGFGRLLLLGFFVFFHRFSWLG